MKIIRKMKGGMSDPVIAKLFWIIFALCAMLVLAWFLSYLGGRMFPVEII